MEIYTKSLGIELKTHFDWSKNIETIFGKLNTVCIKRKLVLRNSLFKKMSKYYN